MTQNIGELKNLIVQKNLMLDSINHNEKRNREKVRSLKSELDNLLYQYYKLLKCG